jgi:2,3,4,5-tetrahydropyridine-2-carboxylate N-succinyltransferase
MERTESNNSADLQWMRTTLERAYDKGPGDEEVDPGEVNRAADALIELLGTGRLRVAELQGHRWSVNVWIKKGLLLALEIEGLLAQEAGRYIAPDVSVKHPNSTGLAAFIDEGVVMEEGVLIGECAQVGKRVHFSTDVKLGGMLEPVQASPVIIEDDVHINGGCGIYDSTLVRRRAVLGAGVILTRSTSIYDVVKGDVLHSAKDRPLEIPDGAVVVPGTRKVEGEWGAVHGLGMQCQIIVGYRDEEVSAQAALAESVFRLDQYGEGS